MRIKLLTILALVALALYAAPASAGGKKTPKGLLPSVSQVEKLRATDEARPNYLYIVCDGENEGWHGSFDLADGGVFAYCLGEVGYREKVHYLGEISNYYIFQEQDFENWYWAISSTPNSSGTFTLYGTFGTGNYNVYGYATRCEITP